MESRRPVIFLSAAEASGDEHAARLVAALRRRMPEARLIGVAGEKMAAEGCEVVEDMTRQASMLFGPLLKVPYYFRRLQKVKKAIRELRPDVVVPVDSPAFNWHLAKTARQVGSTVVYYIAPQVWAWAPWRVKKLARLTDHVACILPFEEFYLQDRGVHATFVGHPLLETLPARPDPMPDIVDAWANGAWRIALLPGSRPGEIDHHTPALLEVADAVNRRWPGAKFAITARNEEAAVAIRKAAKRPLPEYVEIVAGRTRETLAGSHFAVAVSGTVTLEVAHFGVPMVIFYRVPLVLRLLRKLLGKWGVPTASFSLVNILAGHKIVPELMPWNGRTRRLIDRVMEVMEELGYLLEARAALLKVVDSLRVHDEGHASDRAAEIIVQTIKNRERRSPGTPIS